MGEVFYIPSQLMPHNKRFIKRVKQLMRYEKLVLRGLDSPIGGNIIALQFGRILELDGADIILGCH